MKVIATLASNGRHFGSVTVSIGPFPFHDSHNPSSIEARSGPPNQEVDWAKADENIVMAITKKTIPPLDKPKRSAPVLHHQPAALPKGAVKTEPRKLGATGALGPLTACRGGGRSDPTSNPYPTVQPSDVPWITILSFANGSNLYPRSCIGNRLRLCHLINRQMPMRMSARPPGAHRSRRTDEGSGPPLWSRCLHLSSLVC